MVVNPQKLWNVRLQEFRKDKPSCILPNVRASSHIKSLGINEDWAVCAVVNNLGGFESCFKGQRWIV